ncbi:MAG: ABC transporter permease [Bacillota bacterium]
MSIVNGVNPGVFGSLPDNAFEHVGPIPEEQNLIVRPPTTYWQDAWRRLKKNFLAMCGLYVIIFFIALAIFGPMLTGYTYFGQVLQDANKAPSLAHWFGTDHLGRDELTRIFYGARISLSIGIVASVINLAVGALYGGISGLVGGRTDNVMMRIVDIIYGIPLQLVVILLMVVMGSGLLNIYVALGLVYWLGMARIVRGQVLALKEQEFVLAARMVGADQRRLLLRHLIPNTMGPIIVTLTLSIPQAIFTEAWLSFIGLGVAAPMASWGVLASEGVGGLRSYPWQTFFPAAAISLTMLAFNFLGDGLRDALDPRLRR